MAEIMDGRTIAKNIREGLKEKVIELKEYDVNPKLAVVMVGEDKSSKIYVKNKNKACEEIGITFEEFLLPTETTMEELLGLLEKLNKDDKIHGILLQSPLPKHLDINIAFQTIDPKKDVDGFHPVNVGKLCLGQDTFVPCTPFGVIKMLEEYKIPIEGKNVIIIGRSSIVGRPLSQCMLNKNATITICHSKTQDLGKITQTADILITAIGKPRLVTADMVKEGAVIVDIGINRLDDGKIVGDVDFDDVSKKASYITPVPGGTGPMTVAMLMNNVIKAAQNQVKEA